jgi:hypothetical protein
MRLLISSSRADVLDAKSKLDFRSGTIGVRWSPVTLP